MHVAMGTYFPFFMATTTSRQLAKPLLWHSCQSMDVDIEPGLLDLLLFKDSTQIHNARNDLKQQRAFALLFYI